MPGEQDYNLNIFSKCTTSNKTFDYLLILVYFYEL